MSLSQIVRYPMSPSGVPWINEGLTSCQDTDIAERLAPQALVIVGAGYHEHVLFLLAVGVGVGFFGIVGVGVGAVFFGGLLNVPICNDFFSTEAVRDI